VRLVFSLPVGTMSDNDLGWKYRPFAEILHTSEGYARNTMNSSGFNERNRPKTGAAFRVLLMGDSMTESLASAGDKKLLV